MSPTPSDLPPATVALTDDQWREVWHYSCLHAQTRMAPFERVKRWFKSKTVWCGKAVALVGLLLEYLQGQEGHVLAMFGAIGPHAFVGIGLTIIVLRFVTSGKLTK